MKTWTQVCQQIHRLNSMTEYIIKYKRVRPTILEEITVYNTCELIAKRLEGKIINYQEAAQEPTVAE